MKRPCPWARERARRIQAKTRRREQAAAKARRHRFRRGSSSVQDFETVALPSVLVLGESHRDKLLRAISMIRANLAVAGRPVLLDFSAVEKIYPEGMLLLSAEITRCKELKRHKRCKLRVRLPRNPKCAAVLKQIGLLDIARPLAGRRQDLDVHLKDEDVVEWRYAMGQAVSTAAFDEIIPAAMAAGDNNEQALLYAGFSEAMQNCHDHAYLEERGDGLRGYGNTRWWCFSQRREGKLSVVVCDLGIGIPRAFPMNPGHRAFLSWCIAGLRQGLTSFQGRNDHPEIIEAAFQYTRTRTGLSNRGKGLTNIRNVIEKIEEPGRWTLTIMSGRGGWFISRTDGVTSKKRLDFKSPLLGTLIAWTIPDLGGDRGDSNEGN